MAPTKPIFYSAYFCPYAQRAWCCLNFLGIDYELVEALGSGMDAAYTKHPDLLESNPKGLVPTLLMTDGTVKCESIDILRDLYCERYPTRKDEFDMLHDEAVEWNKLICSPFYRVLMKPDEAGRQEAWHDMLDGMEAFSDKLSVERDSGISFYNYSGKQNDDEPSLVDFTVFPFIHRLYIVKHYRGFRLDDGRVGDKIRQWQAKMEALPAVTETMANRQTLIDVYLRYADGSAQSKVGDAVRSGKEAHEI